MGPLSHIRLLLTFDLIQYVGHHFLYHLIFSLVHIHYAARLSPGLSEG